MKTNIVVDISPSYFTTSPISGKILVLELWAKMLSANQIAGFFKMYYLKKKVNGGVYVWHADKNRSFLRFYTIILGVRSQTGTKYSK